MRAGKTTRLHDRRIGLGAEMAHVGVERLGAGDAEEHAAEHEKALQAAADQIVEAVERIDRGEDRRMLDDPVDAERRDDDEPERA